MDGYGKDQYGLTPWGSVNVTPTPTDVDELPKVKSALSLAPTNWDVSKSADGIALRCFLVGIGTSDNDIGGA